jgi:hypothetical protein
VAVTHDQRHDTTRHTGWHARYGAKRKSDDPDTRAFSEAFRAGYAPKLLETLLQLLSGIPNGEFLPGRLVAVALNFMGHAYVVHNFCRRAASRVRVGLIIISPTTRHYIAASVMPTPTRS